MCPPAKQLTLFEPHALLRPPAQIRPKAEDTARRLSQLLGMDVRLSITDNRSTVISFKRRPQTLVLRLHHMFLDAPEPIVRAIAAYAGLGKREAGPVLDEYIRTNRVRLRPSRGPTALKQRGLFHDLQAMFDQLNQRYFESAIEARIGWGRLPGTRGRRSIRMGVYLHEERVIRIHPALDRPEVPSYFVEFVVFHEMLHQAVPAERCGGRRQHHGREFRKREKTHPDFARALAWEKANLDLLLGTRQSPEHPNVRS